ncbi:MAG TPA: hypothetical protein VFQ45_21865 [Longimicrobium sp.]|nr:hypothetical protein [Longimicrobium sp.]
MRLSPAPLLVFLLVTSACSRDRAAAPAKEPAIAQAEPAASPGSATAADSTLWLIGADGKGEITASTTAAELEARFGAANVRHGEVMLAEGEMSPGTTLFADDSTRMMEIVWHDTASRARPQLAIVHGTTGRWAVAPGIRLGTTLAELEALNGGPFTFSGFDWDYGGFIGSWRGGRLESLRSGPRSTIVRLDVPAAAELSDDESRRIAGDRELRSDDPLLQRLNPYVSEITVSFGEA